MKIILIILCFLATSCASTKFDKTCDAYWSGNPNHKPGE